jgi:integrase/recombinase XerC
MMETYLAAFQRYLDIERQASPHTLRNYLSDLHQFVCFASGRLGPKVSLTPAQIDASLIRDFLSTLYQQGVGHTTLARKLASLRSFLHFLQQQGYVSENVAGRCSRQNRRLLPNVLPMTRCLGSGHCVTPVTVLSLRSGLFSASGYPVSELVALIPGCRLPQWHLAVQGKGRREHRFFLVNCRTGIAGLCGCVRTAGTYGALLHHRGRRISSGAADQKH